MVILCRFKSFFYFLCYCRLIAAFSLSSALLRRGVFHHLVATLYLCDDDSNKLSEFDQSNKSYYNHQYVEELES